MRTLNFEIIDEMRVVRSVGFPTVDPVATMLESIEAMRKTEIGEEYQELFRLATNIPGSENARRQALEEMRQEILEKTFAFQRECERYAQANPVWFDTIPGEIVVIDQIADSFIAKLKSLRPNQVVTVDGNILPDNRGRTMHRFDHTDQRWCSKRVDRLGEVLSEGWNWSDDLTDDQLVAISFQQERERIASMTPEQRAALMETEIDVAAKQCAQLRSTLEIKGEPDALSIARKRYEDLKLEIEIKYGLRGNGVTNVGSNEREEDTEDRSGRVGEGPGEPHDRH